jgi:general secretion pathway protein L
MMATGDWLLLRLPAAAGEAPSWAAVDASGALLPLPGSDAGGDLAALAHGRSVALLVPAAEVALFSVPLPAGNEARLQQLAPFALEEQVSEDLENLHFAVGVRDGATGEVPVAVVDRERIPEWLALAAQLGVMPRALYAESDLAPQVPGHVTMLLADGELILRNGAGRPVTFPPDDPELALSALLGPDSDTGAVSVVVYASPADWEQYEARIESLRAQVGSLRVQLFTSGLLGLYAQGIGSGAAVNLLQGPFKPQVPGANAWRRWRTAAALLVGLLLLQAAASLWELRQSRRESARLDAEITRVYASIFPGQKPGRTPRRTLEDRMRAVAGTGSPKGELMPLLAAAAAAHDNVPVARLDSMTFKPGSLQLMLSAPDGATLEQFSQALRAGGYEAKVTNGSQTDSGFRGQVDLTAAGS